MKLNNIFYGLAATVLLGGSITACTDNIAVGDASLDKAASSTATIDTVFQNAEYTRQFLVGIYSKQYYGLPYANAGTNAPHAGNPYAGKFDALTDCWHDGWNGAAVFGQYYNGSMTASVGRADGLDGPLYSYDKEYQWKSIRAAEIFLANVYRTPEMTTEEKNRLKAEARCLMVDAFFNTFQHYGGIPIIDHALETSETTAEFPRCSVDSCVNWMVNQLDSAITGQGSGDFPWITSDPATMCGRWTKAGAMALKCKILQFAASPLLNPKDNNPYYEGASEEVKPYIMYTDGSKYQARWDRFYNACKAFFDALSANGKYYLKTATGLDGTTANDGPRYRLAYRQGYFLEDSPEILHSVRVMQYDNFSTARYCWHSWYTKSVPRNAYWPTEEYVEKFPYSDGEPFNWKKAWAKTFTVDASGDTVYIKTKHGRTNAVDMTPKSLHSMFVIVKDQAKNFRPQTAGQFDPELTRDPRLYEECLVNGVRKNLDWTTASMTGDTWELWVGGTDGLTGVTTQSNTMFGTGYGFNKYYLGDGTTTGGDNLRYQTQWVALSLSDMYLTYAEALMQQATATGNDNYITEAVKQIDMVRSRVGLPSIATIWSSASYREAAEYEATSVQAANSKIKKKLNGVETSELLEELLNERVRELGLTNARWFDMVRYKRTDWMTKKLHALQMHRRRQNAEGNWEDYDIQWANGDKLTDATTVQPWTFSYKIIDITGNKRNLWTKNEESNDARKWLFDPFPQGEINKDYGLVQNPGW